jgi:hypothetical protein
MASATLSSARCSLHTHQAWHFLGTTLNAEGQGLKTIMAALDQKDPKSPMRYKNPDWTPCAAHCEQPAI